MPGEPQVTPFCTPQRIDAEFTMSRIAADLEREALASSWIAVSVAAAGRVTEQGIDAGGVLG